MEIFVKHDDDGNILRVYNSREILKNPILEKNILRIPLQNIDLRKDKIQNGELVKWVKEEPKVITQDEYFDIAHRKDIKGYVEPARKVALIARWGDFCGISDYSESLVRNSLIDYTIFCQRDFIVSTFETLKVVPSWMADDRNYDQLLHKILSQNIDIVHIQYNHGLFNAGMLKKFGDDLKRNRIRSIMTFHSTKGGITVFGQHFDEFIVHSKASKQDLLEGGIEEERVHVLPIGNTPLEFIYTKEEACAINDIDFDRPIVGTFGFLLPHKGTDELIKAISIVKETKPNILGIIAASTKNIQHSRDSLETKEKCENLIRELDLKDNILFIAEHLTFEKISELLCCCDLITFSYIDSAAQSSSAAVRNALVIERPILVSDLEVFSDLEDVCPKITPSFTEELADTIISYLDDSKKYNQVVEVIKYYNKQTHWAKVSEKNAEVYKALGQFKLDLEGQVYSYFSASEISRYMSVALKNIGVDIQLSSMNLAEKKDMIFEDRDDFESVMYDIKRKNAVAIRNFYPPSFAEDKRIVVSYIPCETTRIQQEWVENINKNIDYVWTYSTHSKKSIEDSGVKKPVINIGPGFDTKLYNKNVVGLDLSKIPDSYTKRTVPIDENTFVFMFIGAAQKRKGIDTLLKAWYNNFDINDNAVLVIKSYTSGEIHKEILTAQYNSGKELKDYPKLLYVFEDSEPKRLARFYSSCAYEVDYDTDLGRFKAPCGCGILPSRAEGWGWVGMLFGAVGAPMIATNFGGHLDFLNKDNSFLINGKLVESDYHEQGKDSLWCEIDPKELADLMHYVMDNHKERAIKAKKLWQDVHLNWNWSTCAFRIVRWMEENKLYDLK